MWNNHSGHYTPAAEDHVRVHLDPSTFVATWHRHRCGFCRPWVPARQAHVSVCVWMAACSMRPEKCNVVDCGWLAFVFLLLLVSLLCMLFLSFWDVKHGARPWAVGPLRILWHLQVGLANLCILDICIGRASCGPLTAFKPPNKAPILGAGMSGLLVGRIGGIDIWPRSLEPAVLRHLMKTDPRSETP